MSAACDDGVTCPKTGVRLVAATGEVGYRVALSSRGALHVYPRREVPGGRVEYQADGGSAVVGWWQQPAWSRFDTVGRTLYTAATRAAAFTEALQDKRQKLHAEHLHPLADAMGMTLSDYVAAFESEASAAGMMPIGQIPAGWRHDRLMYRVTLPTSGWWIDAEHGDTMTTVWNALGPELTAAGRIEPITRAHMVGEDRCLTLTVARYLRGIVLFDGARPLGIRWGSKLGYGINNALWLRNTDDGGTPADDGVAADNGQPIDPHDADLRHIADQLHIRIH